MPTKLLLLITDLARGGTPSVVRDLAIRLRARGHEVQVGCLAGPGDTSVEIAAAGVPVHVLDARSATDVRVFVRLARLIRKERYTHVLSFLVHANTAAALVRPFVPRGIRWFQSIQTTQPWPAWHWRVQRLVAQAAELVIVPTPSVADMAREVCQVPDEKLVVVPNAVDIDGLGKLGRLRERVARVGFLGRLDRVKRVEDLIGAMRRLPDLELHVYGDGPERGRLESAARGLTSVTFHGLVSSPPQALEHLDVLVLPSEAEGFGLVLIEAMAAGVPVVCSDAPGIRDVVRDGETGLMFPVGDVPAIAQAIRRLADDSQLRERLVRNARDEVARRYGWAGVIEAYERELEL